MQHSGPSTPQSQKSNFDGLYDRDDPVHYFTTLQRHDYRTPGVAQPIFRRCVSRLRQLRDRTDVTVLDLCCGYGVNAALINHDLTLDDLYRHYARSAKHSPETRIVNDRQFFRRRRRAAPTTPVIGIDVAQRALAYASQTGLLDKALAVNLERDALTSEERASVAKADLITVTGGLSYVGVRTFLRLLSAFSPDRLPWLAFFPLRHMDVRSLAALFREHGMIAEAWDDRAFKHRNFTDAGERERLLDQIDDRIDPVETAPSETWIEAVFYLARPRREAARSPLSALVEGRAEGLDRTADSAWSSQR